MIKITQILQDFKGTHYKTGENQECPFHVSKSKNSFTINTEDNGFYCFSSKCNAHKGTEKNNVFRLISLIKNCNIAEAKKLFFEKYGEKKTFSEEQKKKFAQIQEEKKIVDDILNAACEHYHKNIDFETIDEVTIREHQKSKRNFTDKTINNQKIGYAKSFRYLIDDPLYNTLREKYSDDQILLSGLYQKYDDKISPIFKGRIIYPYLVNGEARYFIGRATKNTPKIFKDGKELDPEVISKYKKQLVYNKEKKPYVSKQIENILFGLDTLNIKDDKILITEGVTDAISLIQAGFKVISPITTKFNEKDNLKINKIIDQKDKVFIINDNEENNEGFKGAVKTAKYLFSNLKKHIYITKIPKDDDIEKIDINDYLSHYDIEEHNSKIKRLLRYIDKFDKDSDTIIVGHSQHVLSNLINEFFEEKNKGNDGKDQLIEIFKTIMFYDSIEKEFFLTKLKNSFKKTGFDKSTLKKIDKLVNDEQIKKELEDRKRLEEDFDEYYFCKERFGTFFINESFHETRGKIKTEICSFKEIYKEKKEYIDVFDNKTITVNNNIVSVPLLSPDIVVEASDAVETSFIMQKAKHQKNYDLKPNDINSFIEKFNENENIKIKETKSVNVHCYQNNKYYEPKSFECYNETQTLTKGIRKTNRVRGNVSDDYNEFLDVIPNKDIVKRCVDDLNSLPVNHEDAQIWKGILCKSIAMMLKMDLVSMGVKFFPIDIIMGDKGTGKTTLNKLLVRCLWNSQARSNTEMNGVMGARLDYPNDIRPIVYEELTEFKKNWVDMLKEGMTRGVFTIKKGTPDQGQNVKRIYQNFFLDTNEFNVNDEAFEQRMCFWHKNIKIDGKDNLDVINNLEANIKHVGKFLYDSFSNINTCELWGLANKDISKLYPTKDIRKGIKYAQIRFGELVLEKILPSLFEHVMLDYPSLLDKKSYFLFNKEYMLKDKIKFLVSKVSIRVHDEPEYTITNFLDISETSFKAKQLLYDKHGLLVSTGGNICLTRKFLPIINNELQGIKKFNSLKEITTILGEEAKTTEYDFGKGKSTMTAINITKIIKEE